VLIAVVLLVWYQVFMRVKSNFSNDEVVEQSRTTSNEKLNEIKRDTFTLLANYRDPFGSEAVLNDFTTINPFPEPIPVKIKPLKAQTPWPKINYFGLVRNTESKTPLGIVEIDGLKMFVRTGDHLFDGLNITKITREEINISYKKEKRNFTRN
jgi:hypothetical protein